MRGEQMKEAVELASNTLKEFNHMNGENKMYSEDGIALALALLAFQAEVEGYRDERIKLIKDFNDCSIILQNTKTKLAKAVEGLERISHVRFNGSLHGVEGDIARETLKGIEDSKTCPDCDGSGWRIYQVGEVTENESDREDCPRCKGSGKIGERE